jgi:hypothetical protein
MNNFMFLLGLFSLLQLLFIPGIIILKAFNIRTTSKIQLLLYSFGLSLYSNYLLVCILTWLRIYISPVIYIIFSSEIIYLFYFLYRNPGIILSAKSFKGYYHLLKDYLSQLSLKHKIIFAVACVFILFFISFIPFSTGTSYYFIDALNHWTRWPSQWASNIFPPGTRHYPQLFPANLSLMFVFTGESAYQFFPKALMPFFFIGNLLIFLDLSIYRKSLIDLTGLLIYGFILLIFYSVLFILEVNADIPVSFFSLLTFYTIARNEEKEFDIKTIILVTVFASSAALTKLAGSYILMFAGLWIIYIIIKKWKTIPFSIILRTVVYILLILFGSILWYLVRPAEMLNGLDQSIYLVPDYYARFMSAAKMLFYTLGIPFFLFLSVTVIASLFVKETRYLVLLIIIPALILWAFFFSADFRNLSFAVPFIAYTSAYGLWFLYKKIITNKKNITNTSIYLIKNRLMSSILVVLFFMLTFILSGTDYVFNFAIKLSYLFHVLLFGNYQVAYFSEIGYYRYVEYIISAFRLLCIIMLALFILRKARIQISYLIIFAFIISGIAGFTLLKKESIWKKQIEDIEMVKIHNLYSKIYPVVNVPNQKSLIITNNLSYNQLVPPPGVSIFYTKDINENYIIQQKSNSYKEYLLLKKDKLGYENLRNDKNNTVCFEDEEFLFLSVLQ